MNKRDPKISLPSARARRSTLTKNSMYAKFLAWVDCLAVPYLSKLLDPECLEISDSAYMPARLEDLRSMRSDDARDPLSVLLAESPARMRTRFFNVDLTPAQWASISRPHSAKIETTAKRMTIGQWTQAMERIRDVTIPAFYELYAGGRSDKEARDRVAQAVMLLNPLVLPSRLGPQTAVERMLPEVIQDDLLESYFNYRRAGRTAATEKKAEAKRAKRAADKPATEKPTLTVPRSSHGASYERLGMDRSQVVWKRKRNRNVTQAIPRQLMARAIPEHVDAVHSFTVGGEHGQRYSVREFAGRVFEINAELLSETGAWCLWDTIACQGSERFNRTRLKAVLEAAIDVDEWPDEVRAISCHPGALLYVEPKEEYTFLDSIVHRDDGAVTPWVHL